MGIGYGGVVWWGMCGEVCKVRYVRWDAHGEIYMR